MACRHTGRAELTFSFALILAILTGVLGVFTVFPEAAVTTVTLKNGSLETYGSYSTYKRWVTHVNGEPVDLDEEAGITRSYAYCVQPTLPTLGPGKYSVTVIDDDNTGRTEKMRKLIYYLPGSYGYKLVTKTRWFSEHPGGVSDYAMGHIALSYVYDNCKDSTDAWKGCNSAVRNKVKAMITDLDELDDPPEEYEVFWVKVSGNQDVFGAIYATEYGYAEVMKTSANETITDDNDCYSLAGAQYVLYKDEACTEAAETKSGERAVIITQEDGSSEAVQVETGKYYMKEECAPYGYAPDPNVYELEVRRKTTTYTGVTEVPQSNVLGLVARKADMETGESRPQGAASLANAVYTVKYYDVVPEKGMSEDELLAAVSDREPAKLGGKPAVWRFRTDESGTIDVRRKGCLISEKSAGLYRNSKGEPVLPIGIITVQETSAPKGYVLNSKLYAAGIRGEGTTEFLDTFEPLIGDNCVRDNVIRGDISFTKSAGGLRRMKFVPFRITSLTTGESHVVVTDENGYVNTSSQWISHDVIEDPETGGFGTWFNGYNDAVEGAVPADTLCALPYDRYKIEELRCDSNKGYSLFSDTITVKKNNMVIDLGTFDDKRKPEEGKEVPVKSDSPETGDDNTQLYVYAAMCILALAESVLLIVRRKGGRLK